MLEMMTRRPISVQLVYFTIIGVGHVLSAISRCVHTCTFPLALLRQSDFRLNVTAEYCSVTHIHTVGCMVVDQCI